MSIRAYGTLAGAAALLALASSAPAHAQALSERECSARYQAAKSAGNLGGMNWNQFRRSVCAAGATAAPAPAPAPRTAAPPAAPGVGLTMRECSARYQAAKSSGNLGGMSWNEFRRAECSADAAAAPAPAPSPAPRAAAPSAAPAPSGGALSQQECSDLYQSAKASGDLLSRTWNEFRRIECSAEAAANLRTGRAVAGSAPGTAINAIFPRTVSPRYANESAGKARMHTCLDQYLANKASNGNAGLRWIQKGGGYYSECNRRLKVTQQ